MVPAVVPPADPGAAVPTAPATPPNTVAVDVPTASDPDLQSIEYLETALVELLKARPALLAFQVEAWPEDVSKYKLRSRYGALLVSYKGSVFGKDSSTDGVSQLWTLNFEVVTLCRNLRSHRGGYRILDEIRRAVTGWFPPAAIDNAYPTHEGFVGEEDGVWQYATYLSVPSINVQEDQGGEELLGGALSSTSPYPGED